MCEKEPKRKSCTTCPQYDGTVCQATGIWLGDKELILHQEARRGFICLDTEEAELKGDAALKFAEVWADDHDKIAKSVDDTMYHPNAVADSKDLHSVTVWPPPESNTFKMTIRLVDSDDSAAGSPSSECPSLQEGPPQKGKIEDSDPLETGVIVKCGEGVPILPGTVHFAYDTQIGIVEDPPPLFTVDLFEPRQKSCISCKHYQDPVCDACGRVIGTMLDLAELEEVQGFHCFAADRMQREE